MIDEFLEVFFSRFRWVRKRLRGVWVKRKNFDTPHWIRLDNEVAADLVVNKPEIYGDTYYVDDTRI